MKTVTLIAAAITMLALHASLAVAGGGSRSRAHGAQAHQPRVHQQWQHSHQARESVQHNSRGAHGQAHTHFGGPRLEQRSDPNNQNPYRPMFSLDAVNPGETHPYFQTRKEGFGYPPAQPAPVYQGNGVYFIPR